MVTRSETRMESMVGDLLGQPYIVQTIKEITERQRASLAMIDRLRAVDVSSPIFWPFHAPPLPLCVTEAEGCRIKDLDGHEYLDCHLGWGAQALHGHNPRPVVEFVQAALGRGPGNGYFHPIELDLAELLGELLPHCEKFAFLNSGTDATHAAIRLCRAFTGRRLVAKVEGSLHGVHDLAAHNTAFWYHGHPAVPFPEHVDGAVRAVPALAGVAPAGHDELLVLPHNDERAYELVTRCRHQLACVIAEPVSSSFPFEEKSIPFVRELAQTCRRSRVPFILDEVLTGFRCGISGAAARHHIEADLIAYGKVISGLGLPLSAIGGRADILDLAQTSGLPFTDLGNKTCLNTTHMGTHLALCAAYASLRLLREQGEAYYTATRAKVGRLRTRLAGFGHRHGIPIKLLGFGDFIGAFVFLDDRPLQNPQDLALAINPVAAYALTLMLRKRGVYAFSMPLFFTGGAHNERDLDELYDRLTDALQEMQSNGFPFLPPQ
jgi:glutamate-1-semialdehyde 2,1-aminomutase